MAPFGPVPAMVGNETSFRQRTGRRFTVDPGQESGQRHRIAPMR
jgi:hypothetical protein